MPPLTVVYRTIPTSNHNVLKVESKGSMVVYRTIPTSNHNGVSPIVGGLFVVYRTIPTSNHNTADTLSSSGELYIVLFLHQTTTRQTLIMNPQSCISYYSYIKPQLLENNSFYQNVVYRTIPTSNHNVPEGKCKGVKVVYRTIPTSNHNYNNIQSDIREVVYRTIPTSNHNRIFNPVVSIAVVYRTIPTSNHNR